MYHVGVIVTGFVAGIFMILVLLLLGLLLEYSWCWCCNDSICCWNNHDVGVVVTGFIAGIVAVIPICYFGMSCSWYFGMSPTVVCCCCKGFCPPICRKFSRLWHISPFFYLSHLD